MGSKPCGEILPCDNLLLIIGSNPLPNYIIASYFLSCVKEQELNIWLIHSYGTKEIAKQIESALLKDGKNSEAIKRLSTEKMSSPDKIKERISSTINSGLTGKYVHLNYTGGTKLLAVHIYQVVNSLSKSYSLSFSYLNAKKDTLYINNGIGSGKSISLFSTKISISLPKLLELHNYKDPKVDAEEDMLKWKKSLSEIEKLLGQNHFSSLLQLAKCKPFRELRSNKSKKKFTQILACINLDLNAKDKCCGLQIDGLIDIFESLPEEHRILDSNRESLVFPGKTVRQARATVRFFTGGWLEYYVYNIIEEILNEFLHEFPKKFEHQLSCSLKSERQGTTSDFEIDVIVILGYRLFGISCTTDTRKNICKGKGFEVLHRVQQIGGDESGAMLITCLNEEKARELHDDLHNDLYFESKFKILGHDDLQRGILKDKLREHLLELYED